VCRRVDAGYHLVGAIPYFVGAVLLISAFSENCHATFRRVLEAETSTCSTPDKTGPVYDSAHLGSEPAASPSRKRKRDQAMDDSPTVCVQDFLRVRLLYAIGQAIQNDSLMSVTTNATCSSPEDQGETTSPEDPPETSSSEEQGRTSSFRFHQSSYWSVPEQIYFPEMLDYFGRDWAGISSWMQTKTSNMVSRYPTQPRLKRVLELAHKKARSRITLRGRSLTASYG
jgi:hypothetical protein